MIFAACFHRKIQCKRKVYFTNNVRCVSAAHFVLKGGECMQQPLPVILGNDLNAYSVAIAFHRRFGVKSHVFGRYACGITAYSRLCVSHVTPNLSDPAVARFVLTDFCASHPGRERILIPASDWYLRAVQGARGALREAGYRFVLPPEDVWRVVSDKASFTAKMQEYGIAHPRTLIFDAAGEVPDGMCYPAVLKAADSALYYLHTFSGMKKVWFPRTREEAAAIAARIAQAGYSGTLLLQEYIEPQSCSTLTLLIREDGTLYAGAAADVVLEERGDSARGNYAALLVRAPHPIERELACFASRIGYRGVCNFDILYRAGRPYVLEMNPRQGRSCDFLRAAGIDLAGFLSARPDPRRRAFCEREVYWRCVPEATVRRHTRDAAVYARARGCAAAGRVFSPFDYRPDLSWNPIRGLYTALHLSRRARAIAKEKE